MSSGNKLSVETHEIKKNKKNKKKKFDFTQGDMWRHNLMVSAVYKTKFLKICKITKLDMGFQKKDIRIDLRKSNFFDLSNYLIYRWTTPSVIVTPGYPIPLP